MTHSLRYLALGLIPLVAVTALCETAPLVLGSYPMPQAETEDVVTQWLKKGGFAISRRHAESGETILKGERQGEAIRIEIRPRSALASEVQVGGAPSDGYRRETVEDLKSALHAHLSRPADSKKTNPAPGGARAGTAQGEKRVPVPEKVRPQGEREEKRLALPPGIESKAGSIVCLEALTKEGPVQFTGFVIDRRGLILSTAHDVGAVHRIMTSRNGEELKGEVVKQDLRRDLSLIKVSKSFKSAVSVQQGRSRLKKGDTVYSIGCPEGNVNQAQVGTVDRPPALVSGQRLWQLHMEVQPGSSGSPVFDAEGRLVGVVKGRFRGTETRGFVIPLDTVREFLK